MDVSLVFPLKLKFGQSLNASGDCSSFHLLTKLTCETYLTHIDVRVEISAPVMRNNCSQVCGLLTGVFLGL